MINNNLIKNNLYLFNKLCLLKNVNNSYFYSVEICITVEIMSLRWNLQQVLFNFCFAKFIEYLNVCF